MDLERSTTDGDISLGRELRRAREVRGITVSQIAQETKINERYIHALENDRLDLLPGQPYTGNFVRSIARSIGADEEELIDYLNYHLRIQQPERRDDSRSSSRERARPGLPLVIVVGGVLLVVMITMALRGGDESDSKAKPPREPQRMAAQSPAAAPAGSAQVLPATVDTALLAAGAPGASGASTAAPSTAPRAAAAVLGTLAPVDAASGPAATAAPDAPVGASGGPLASAPAGASADEGPAPRVRLVFREKSWVEIEQDGDAVPLLGIRQVGEELTWTLDRPLRMKINNAGGVDLFLDGQAAKPLGGPRETRTLVIDRRNWKSLVR